MPVHFGALYVPKKGLNPSKETEIGMINHRPLHNLARIDDNPDAWIYIGGLPSSSSSNAVAETEVHLADELTRLEIPFLQLPGSMGDLITIGTELTQALSAKLIKRNEKYEEMTRRGTEELARRQAEK